MLRRVYTINISIRMQRNCFGSYLEILNNVKQFSDIFPRMKIRRHHSRLNSLIEPEPVIITSRTLCYSTRRNTSYSNSCYSSLLRNQWAVGLNCNINSILSTSSVQPRFQVRHFSGQSGEETLGIWTRLFLWLSESTPVNYAQDFLSFVHNSTGLPWWTTIILTTVFLRTVVTVPLAVYQHHILAKVENLQLLEMPEIVKELKRETAVAMKKFNWTEKEARIVYNRSLKKQWNNLIIRDNCHPFKASVLLWVQLPMWIFLSVSLRNLVYMLPHNDGAAMVTYMELSVGGFGWIPNLLVPDESLVLPVALGLVNLAIVELQTMSKVRKDSKFQKYVTHLFRALSLAMIPVAASVPSCLNLYWVTSSTYGLVQNLILLSPRVKRLGRIPESPSQLENPYKHIASEIRLRAARISTFWNSQVKN